MGLLFRLIISLPPDLEDAGVLHTGLVIEIKGVKNQRLVLRIKHATVRFAGSAAAIHIEDVGNVELSSAHQFANVAVRCQVLLVVTQLALLVVGSSCQFVDSRCQ